MSLADPLLTSKEQPSGPAELDGEILPDKLAAGQARGVGCQVCCAGVLAVAAAVRGNLCWFCHIVLYAPRELPNSST